MIFLLPLYLAYCFCIETLRGLKLVEHNTEKIILCLIYLKDIQKKSYEEKCETFMDICQNFQPVFRYFCMEKFLDPAVWFEKRLAYTRSVATSSIGNLLHFSRVSTWLHSYCKEMVVLMVVIKQTIFIIRSLSFLILSLIVALSFCRREFSYPKVGKEDQLSSPAVGSLTQKQTQAQWWEL